MYYSSPVLVYQRPRHLQRPLISMIDVRFKKIYIFIYLFIYLFIFRERGREGERDGKKHRSDQLPLEDLACNPGLCPDWESNQRPFRSQAGTQSTEPHQPGLVLFLSVLDNRWVDLPFRNPSGLVRNRIFKTPNSALQMHKKENIREVSWVRSSQSFLTAIWTFSNHFSTQAYQCPSVPRPLQHPFSSEGLVSSDSHKFLRSCDNYIVADLTLTLHLGGARLLWNIAKCVRSTPPHLCPQMTSVPVVSRNFWAALATGSPP